MRLTSIMKVLGVLTCFFLGEALAQVNPPPFRMRRAYSDTIGVNAGTNLLFINTATPTTANGFSLGTTALPFDSLLNRYTITSRSISSGGMIISQGTTDYYTLPTSTGTRLFWQPSKRTFVAGSFVGTRGDSLQSYEFIFGENNKIAAGTGGGRNYIISTGSTIGGSGIVGMSYNSIFGGVSNNIRSGNGYNSVFGAYGGDIDFGNTGSNVNSIFGGRDLTFAGNGSSSDNTYSLGGGGYRYTGGGNIVIHNRYKTTQDTLNYTNMFLISAKENDYPLVIRESSIQQNSNAYMVLHHAQLADTTSYYLMSQKQTAGWNTGTADFILVKGTNPSFNAFALTDYVQFMRYSGSDGTITFNHSKTYGSYGPVLVKNSYFGVDSLRGSAGTTTYWNKTGYHSGLGASYMGALGTGTVSANGTGGLVFSTGSSSNRINTASNQANMVLNSKTTGKLFFNFDSASAVMINNINSSTTALGIKGTNGYLNLTEWYRSGSGTAVAKIDSSGAITSTWNDRSLMAWGEAYITDSDPDTITVASAGTFYVVKDMSASAVTAQNMTVGDSSITATVAGKYKITVTGAMENNTNNTQIDMAVFVNDSEITRGHSHAFFPTGTTDNQVLSIDCLLSLAANDIVKVKMTADNTSTIIVWHFNMNLTRFD